jgi:hypothetical protein
MKKILFHLKIEFKFFQKICLEFVNHLNTITLIIQLTSFYKKNILGYEHVEFPFLSMVEDYKHYSSFKLP